MATVTQADRDAAADIVGPKSNEGKYPGFACDYREGRCDTSNLVQAFAAHREAAGQAGAKAMQEAAVKVCTDNAQTVRREMSAPDRSYPAEAPQGPAVLSAE